MRTGETGETSWSKEENQQQTQPTYGVDAAGFEPDIAGRRVLLHALLYQPRPQGFSLSFFKGKALGTRLLLCHWPCSSESSRYLPGVIFAFLICICQNDSFLKKSVFLTVSCLSCYTCTSNVSWEDCNSKMTKTGCPSGTPNCAQSLETCTTAGGVKKQIFYKRCGTQGKDCQPKNSPSSCIGSTIPIFGFSSEDMCCSGNNCNSGPRYKVSSSLMGVFILLVFWILHPYFTF